MLLLLDDFCEFAVLESVGVAVLEADVLVLGALAETVLTSVTVDSRPLTTLVMTTLDSRAPDDGDADRVVLPEPVLELELELVRLELVVRELVLELLDWVVLELS